MQMITSEPEPNNLVVLKLQSIIAWTYLAHLQPSEAIKLCEELLSGLRGVEFDNRVLLLEILVVKGISLIKLALMNDAESLLRDIETVGEVDSHSIMLDITLIRFEVFIWRNLENAT